MLVADQGSVRLFFRAVFIFAATLIPWVLWTLGIFVVFRFRPPIDSLLCTKPQLVPIIVRGPYCWVRHPLYLAGILAIWFNLDIALDRLLFNLLFTIWMVVGTILEERDLVAAHEEAYRSYQSKVPILIPWRIRTGWYLPLSPFSPVDTTAQ